MAWVDIPGKPGWQFNDAAQPTGRTYLGKATSELRAAEVSNGVETSGRFLTQTYLQTRYTGDPTSLTFNRGELNATFQNIKNGIAGKQVASYYSGLGGGGGSVYTAGGDPNNPLDANLLNKQIMYLDPIANNGSTIQINSSTDSRNYALTNVTIENSSNSNQPIAWAVDGTSLIEVDTVGYSDKDDLFASAGFPTTDFDGDPNDTFALSVWIKTTNNSADATVPQFGMGFTGDNLVDTYVGVGFDTGIPQWVAYRGSQIGWTNSSSSVGVSDGNWHHVVWAYDAIDNEYSTYIDKVKRSSTILGPWTNSSYFKLDYIGKAYQNSSFVGSIGALRFIFDASNNKITQSEIDQLYQVDAWMYSQGPAQPSLNGNHSYDAEFGYLVGYFTLDTSWNLTTRTVRDFGRSADGLTMFSNSRMSDADYATVMSDATHISILVGPQAQANNSPGSIGKGIVFTKDQVVTNPNVTTLNTTSADTLGRESAVGGYDMFWHDEDTGTGLSGVDYSFVGEFQGQLRDWGSSSRGYNNVSAVGGVAVTDTGREYTGDWVAVWVTNSGVAPVIS